MMRLILKTRLKFKHFIGLRHFSVHLVTNCCPPVYSIAHSPRRQGIVHVDEAAVGVGWQCGAVCCDLREPIGGDGLVTERAYAHRCSLVIEA